MEQDRQDRLCIFYHFSYSQNAELFTLTYGAIVAQLLKDFDSVDEVNNQLEKMYGTHSPLFTH